MTQAVPAGFGAITASLTVSDARKAIDLYKKAFSAKEDYVMACPETDKVMHACLQIGNSKLFVADIMPGMDFPATMSSFYVYLDDVDAAFAQATKAGMTEAYAVNDMFWGDRTGTVTDPFGNQWTLATHVRDVPPEEMEKAGQEFAARMKGKAA